MLETGASGAAVDAVAAVLGSLEMTWTDLARALEDQGRQPASGTPQAPPSAHARLDLAWQSATGRERAVLVTTMDMLSAERDTRRRH